MTYFFTSDTHFYHANIIKFSPNRSWLSDANEMNEILIERWNYKVTPRDTVYHLGDFAFATADESIKIMKRLRGRVHLILGNHDTKLRKCQDSKIPSHFSLHDSYHEIKLDGKFVVLSHYPILSWNRQRYGSIHLHGHCHGLKPEGYPAENIMDVGVDTTETLSPYSWDEVLKSIGRA